MDGRTVGVGRGAVRAILPILQWLAESIALAFGASCEKDRKCARSLAVGARDQMRRAGRGACLDFY
jgi:hypothetical protein